MARSLVERSKSVVSPVLPKYGTTEVARGKGVYLYSPDGKKYLDFGAGIGVLNTGHCHPKIVEAAKKQIDELIHACVHVSWYPQYVELAERLARILPELEMSYFGNSGTEAVEGAMKLARYVTKKPAIIAFQGAFHGRTLGAASVTGKAVLRRRYEPLLPSVYHTPYPWCYRCSFGQRRETCKFECFQAIERLLETVVHPEEVAAVIIEPIMGEGGYYIAPDAFLQKLRTLTEKHEILLIVDEIQSGMGRTGKMFAWQHVDGFVPDVMTIAKALGSGFPISAILGRADIMNKWEKGAHGSTFGGNPVSCAAALATLDVIESEGLLANAELMGNNLFERLLEMKSEVEGIGDVRGRGLMLAIEFTKKDGLPDTDFAKYVIQEAEKQGLIVVSGGIHGNVVRLIPPLILTIKQAEAGFSILSEIIYRRM
jgi:4-aminobutyrate aminotransferase